MADNASPNDIMIDKLMDMLPNFLGQVNHCLCFLHIVNLIAKTLLKQFDVPKKDAESTLDDAERELLNLTVGIDLKEMVTVAEAGEGNKDDEENDNIEEWVDKMTLLSDDEQVALRKDVRPVRLVLVKVSNK